MRRRQHSRITSQGGVYPENHPLVIAPNLLSDEALSYDEMLRLAEILGSVKPSTATQGEIKKSSLPVIKGSQVRQSAEANQVLAITADRCLGELSIVFRWLVPLLISTCVSLPGRLRRRRRHSHIEVQALLPPTLCGPMASRRSQYVSGLSNRRSREGSNAAGCSYLDPGYRWPGRCSAD